MTELMNAVVLNGYGGPDKLLYTQVPKPTPQKGEILIKVGACSINNTDISTRTGWYAADGGFQELLQDKDSYEEGKSTWNMMGVTFPRIQGADIVGVAVEIGEGVNPDILNKRVIVYPWIRTAKLADYQYVGSEIDGGFAEYAVIPATNVYSINSELPDTQLATLPCAYSTAENLVTNARVSARDTVIITGASGGVGSAAIELCKIRGAIVIAIVGANKEHLAKELGADYAYARDEKLADNLAKHEVTVTVDLVAGEYFSLVFKSLVVGGRYVTSGAIAGPLVELDMRDLIYKDVEMRGANRYGPEVFQNLLGYIERGLLNPAVAKIFPLSQMEEAQKFFQSKSFFGKVVITPE
ncbi:MAG: zinc-binding dehydrogenase [Okeania sp. SIO3I5]|uniref:alcohol dehydrogenase family protein n=1 Tax=Okeania sp. SIO3I5 TaxID=2607805 RepID=UPI0013BE310B|nr:alcohol dehydrogenase family protein [Okeania sp. SIO3I5]NEQ40116.1 zinc-binding dehydrogenase [Okeania sp. SIO3I5]